MSAFPRMKSLVLYYDAVHNFVQSYRQHSDDRDIKSVAGQTLRPEITRKLLVNFRKRVIADLLHPVANWWLVGRRS